MLNLGKWAHRAGRGVFAAADVPTFAGISGGRTSGMMAALLDPKVRLLFENTGREWPRTYDFLHELDQALGGRITWLEWRPPATKGARPREFQFAVVNYKTADRSGGPFDGFMAALADYRIAKGETPVAPWARSRMCTAYMKRLVQEHYITSFGIDTYEQHVGLRFDEPDRVNKLKVAETQRKSFRCPLSDAGITKNDVMLFWKQQAFDLNIEEYQGNCSACFLKDQSDIARVLGEPEADAKWWINLESKYDNFGGVNFPGYANLLNERPLRLRAEQMLRAGADRATVCADLAVSALMVNIDEYRLKLVVAQEARRVTDGVQTISCACESTQVADFEQ
jgi:3'-phosphoadenosine 5'-phosphosulfate sulfotransferase (PAPS reductase)/FAD synthetase